MTKLRPSLLWTFLIISIPNNIFSKFSAAIFQKNHTRLIHFWILILSISWNYGMKELPAGPVGDNNLLFWTWFNLWFCFCIGLSPQSASYMWFQSKSYHILQWFCGSKSLVQVGLVSSWKTRRSGTKDTKSSWSCILLIATLNYKI